MAGFLYFRPQQTKNVDTKDVKSWGLSYAFETPPLSRLCHNGTPTGSVGMVFADESRHEKGNVKMDLEAQVWRKMPRPGQPDVYIGYWKESPPEPEDLARKQQLGGYLVPLADGKVWHVPVVRMFDEASGAHKSNLPCYVDVDDAGNPVPGQPLAAWAHLWELTGPFAEQMISESDRDFDSADINAAARTLLQANYVVDWIEIAQARILTTEQMALNIICVAVDWPTYLKWREVSKKKTPSPVTVGG